MIKITNLNFQNQTIENIEVDGEDIHDVALKLTKTTFKIVIKKKGETIKREIKKKDVINEVVDLVMDEVEEVVEPVVEEVVEPVVEEVVEESVMAVVEPVVMEIEEINEILEPKEINLGKLKQIMKEHIPKANTLDSYLRTIQQVYEHFKMTDMAKLFRTKEQDIINYIESQYTNNSTIKSKLCSVYKAYKILNISGDLFKQRIDYYATTQKITHEQTKQDNKKSIEEGEEIIEHFESKMEELRAVIQTDTIETENEMLNNWDVNVQLYCILKIYLSIGVLRPSELLNCLITDTDCDNNTNYINVTSKQIVINCHKNDRKGKKVIEIDDKKLLGILRKGVGRFLVTNQHGGLYESSSAFSKVFMRYFGGNVYDLRKAVSSKCIAEGDFDKIKQLEHNQGHSLNTILEFYNVYNK